MNHLSLVCASAALAFVSFGQGQVSPSTPDSTPMAALSGVWRIPIHTAETDPICGEYGIWASGDAYKVSFHDGFVFYPLLGKEAASHQPFRWTTESVFIGSTAILESGAEAEPQQTDWRYEYRYPGIIEAYDVLPNAVEQTFVLPRRPAATGDLVVRGLITTDLIAPHQDATHGELVFSDNEGEEILAYSEAFVLDASGRRLAIPTSYDGASIELTVPASWLADAEYPVTIDPLTTPKFVGGLGRTTDICRNDELDQLLIVASRSLGYGEDDLVAFHTDDLFENIQVIFMDLGASWDTTFGEGCYNGAGDRWAICMQRTDLRNGINVLRVYLHDQGNTTRNSGPMLYPSPPRGYSEQTPSIGGTGENVGLPLVYLTWRRDLGINYPNTTTSEVWGVTIDVTGSGFIGTPRLLSMGSNLDAEWPSVSKQSQGNDWVIVWQEYDNTIIDDWDIRACRVTSFGLFRNCGAVIGPATTHRHKMFPQVSGAEGRWMFSFLEQDRDPANSRGVSRLRRGDALAVQRGNWDGRNAMTPGPVRYLFTGPISTLNSRRSLAYDFNTTSHWALAYDRGIARLGASGGLVEFLPLPNVGTLIPWATAIAFNKDSSTFAMAINYIGGFTSPGALYGATLSYPSEARCTRYGTSCSGIAVCVNRGTTQPLAGSEFFGFRLRGALPNQGYYLYLAAGSANLPLGGGCLLSLDSSFAPLWFGTTDSSGALTLNVPLPDSPAIIGDLYCQWFTIDRGRILSSNGLLVAIR